MDGEIECRAGDRCATLDRLIEMGEGAQVKRRASAEWFHRNDWRLGKNRLIHFRDCIDPISTWLQAGYSNLDSLVLVDGSRFREC